ncbi:MarC family protein [Chlorogloeopsis sp. ULAP01]|uniref:MarC family protein n=1 Tax=Chlorogloeopsis sp. ULAP01 TaxID=3056483 RepID=UPI0025AA8F92|nr:MarC family protein [Chlorogloeopsis sp. ULAP01]MDM9381264.1 MarC family protein [Chlorogloeopsis sp. ULAP01]
MEAEPFIFTIFFLTIGPIKTIPAFAKIMHSMSLAFKREVAVKGVLIASAICLFIVLLGRSLLARYKISLEAVEIATGIVLLLSALKAIFPVVHPVEPPVPANPTAIQLAISPVASPIIVPPVGIAVILIFIMIAPRYPGMDFAIVKVLSLMMLLNFLVMFFIDKIMKVTGLMLIFNVFAATLVFSRLRWQSKPF